MISIRFYALSLLFSSQILHILFVFAFVFHFEPLPIDSYFIPSIRSVLKMN